MKFYHYTAKQNLASILATGLKPGSDVNQGERLHVVLLESNRYQPQVNSGLAYLEIELAEDDAHLRRLNASQFAYSGTIPASSIVAVADPPPLAEFFDLVATKGQQVAEQSCEYKSTSERI